MIASRTEAEEIRGRAINRHAILLELCVAPVLRHMDQLVRACRLGTASGADLKMLGILYGTEDKWRKLLRHPL